MGMIQVSDIEDRYEGPDSELWIKFEHTLNFDPQFIVFQIQSEIEDIMEWYLEQSISHVRWNAAFEIMVFDDYEAALAFMLEFG